MYRPTSPRVKPPSVYEVVMEKRSLGKYEVSGVNGAFCPDTSPAYSLVARLVLIESEFSRLYRNLTLSIPRSDDHPERSFKYDASMSNPFVFKIPAFTPASRTDVMCPVASR